MYLYEKILCKEDGLFFYSLQHDVFKYMHHANIIYYIIPFKHDFDDNFSKRTSIQTKSKCTDKYALFFK